MNLNIDLLSLVKRAADRLNQHVSTNQQNLDKTAFPLLLQWDEGCKNKKCWATLTIRLLDRGKWSLYEAVFASLAVDTIHLDAGGFQFVCSWGINSACRAGIIFRTLGIYPVFVAAMDLASHFLVKTGEFDSALAALEVACDTINLCAGESQHKADFAAMLQEHQNELRELLDVEKHGDAD